MQQKKFLKIRRRLKSAYRRIKKIFTSSAVGQAPPAKRKYSSYSPAMQIGPLKKLSICCHGKQILSLEYDADALTDISSFTDFSVSVQKVGEDMVKVKSVPDPQYVVDQELIDRLKKVSSFAGEYAAGNYQRIAGDVASITKFFAEKKDMSILDVGGIPPLFTSLLRKEGFKRITLVDPNAHEFADYLNEDQISYITGDLVNGIPPEAVSKYDLVCLNEVIEHLACNVNSVFEAIAPIVAPGGYLYLTTPNQASLHGLFGLLATGSGLASKPFDNVYAQYDRYKKMGYFGHLREYTVTEIIAYMGYFGFECVDISYAGAFWHSNNELHKAVRMLENFFPQMKVFAKYVFKKKS